MDLPKDMQLERITRDNSRSWRGRVLGLLTKRQSDDFVNINVKIGNAGLIRYLAAEYIDPSFVTGAEEAAYRAFGEKIEDAYHEFMTALRAAAAARFSVEERKNGWCVMHKHSVHDGPFADEAAAREALAKIVAEI